MGVYYSFEVAYGVGGVFDSNEDLPGMLKTFAEQNEDFQYDEALRAQLLDLPEGVSLKFGGDQMSGPYRWALVIDKTCTAISAGDFEVLQYLAPLDAADCVGLVDAVFKLDLEGTPGWMLMGNVS